MKDKLKKINDTEWILSKELREGMNVDAHIIANDLVMKQMENAAIEQLTNVAMLPGVINSIWGMPDMHWGYGLPMGAVGAFDEHEGIISSGLTGFDINCGINLINTNLKYSEVQKKLKELIPALFKNIPCGVGSKGKLRVNDIHDVLVNGVDWAIEQGYGVKKDKVRTEELGRMDGADPLKVSETAKKRGKPQLGTLGAGNHFLEVQRVSDILDSKFAKKYELEKDNAMIMLHCGSRGLGHEIASDYLKIHEEAAKKYKIKLPDPQLVCAPAQSKEGQDYFAAMKCAVNYAFANRLVMTQWIRETFEQIFKKEWESMNMHTVYAIAHNICKLENFKIDGKKKKIYIHRKGATRSYPDTPVIIAGSMGTASYLLKGTEEAERTFYSSCHGAGRVMSRNQAISQFKGNEIKRKLAEEGRIVQSTSPEVLAEEAPEAYKDVDEVVDSVHNAKISLRVARMVPMGTVKG
ncbi:RtcB family protein [Candidatus Woesearchaeota archaeon]|nr:RtcB family protein [Candidatus Woesearchaeota archaeon]